MLGLMMQLIANSNLVIFMQKGDLLHYNLLKHRLMEIKLDMIYVRNNCSEKLVLRGNSHHIRKAI